MEINLLKYCLFIQQEVYRQLVILKDHDKKMGKTKNRHNRGRNRDDLVIKNKCEWSTGLKDCARLRTLQVPVATIK